MMYLHRLAKRYVDAISLVNRKKSNLTNSVSPPQKKKKKRKEREDTEGLGVKSVQSWDVLVQVLGTIAFCLGDLRNCISCKGL